MTKAILEADITFADGGKGTCTAALVHKYGSKLVVRSSGSFQCGHNVTTSDNLWHEFSQFGSGTFGGTSTLLSQYVIVNPIALMEEALTLHNKKFSAIDEIFSRVYIDERALVVTPYHAAMNRLRELHRVQTTGIRHGSTGKGIWEAVMYKDQYPDEAIHISDLINNKSYENDLQYKLYLLEKRFKEIAENFNLTENELVKNEMNVFNDPFTIIQIRNLYSNFAESFRVRNAEQVNELIQDQEEPIVFEAAQSILLDQDHGTFPFNSATTTTTENAHKVLDEAGFTGERETVGIMRTFMTRHGAGPFPTEAPFLKPLLNDPHNHTNLWQQQFRVGWLDLPAIKYAIEINGGIDSLAITHVDTLEKKECWWVNKDYVGLKLEKQPTVELVEQNITNPLFNVRCFLEQHHNFDIVDLIQSELNVPIRIKSFGERTDQKEIYEI